MKTNKDGLDLIKSFEGLYLKAYKDMVGVWTIGWGCTVGVHDGMVITEAQAEDLLQKELSTFEVGVPKYVTAPLNENEFAALVSFSYNLGLGSLQHSTLVKFLNNGDRANAADQFLVWNKAGGQPVAGLTRRRSAERALFLKPVASTSGSLLPDGPSDQDINDKLKDIEDGIKS